MRPTALLAFFALAAPSVAVVACGSMPAGKVAADAISTGLAVAVAGVNRAATGDCWATCPPGSACDKESGACKPLPCRGACPSDHRCAMVEGKEACVRAHEPDVAEGAPEEAEGAPEAARADAGAPEPGEDPCRGLCFPGERCEADGGVADCVPARP